MKRVYKYPIPSQARGRFPLLLPAGFKFLRVNFQDEKLMMWCEVTDGNVNVSVEFQCFGTGQDIVSPGAKYLTTYDMGPFVFHLYQLTGLGT